MLKTILLSINLFWISCCTIAATQDITVSLQANQFKLLLPSNPTTGFQLKVKDYDKKALKLVDSRFLPPQTSRIGAGGKMQFTFKRLTSIRETTITMQNARSWEPNTAMVYRVNVHFATR